MAGKDGKVNVPEWPEIGDCWVGRNTLMGTHAIIIADYLLIIHK